MYQPQHPGNRLDGIEVVSAEGAVFRLRATRAATGLLALKVDAPLVLVSAQGAEAKLRQGWDGTLGYSHYGLEVAFATAGEATVTLRSIPPPDKPVPNTDAELAAFRTAYAARPSRFPENAAEFARWQTTYRQKLAGLLMGGGLPQRVPLEPKMLETKDYPKFTLRRLEYRSQADRTNIALLSLPKGVARAPLLVALHGHENDWGDAAEKAYTPGNNDDFCAYFAERGWAVLQPATMNHTLQHPTWTLQGEWSWDAMTAVDYAAALPEVDMQRVAVCGLSTGAHLAMNLLALDDRVKAGVVGCILSTWHHYRRFRVPPHCDCGIMQQISSQLEQCDWAALAAPKPVQFQHGRQDNALCPGADPAKLDLKWNIGVMPPEEYATTFDEVRRAWRLTGAPDGTETHFHDGPHSVNNPAAFEWLSQWVK
ncbi:MAG: hypothetical protein A3K19_17120 [Lentisphaerae bacterium RIFOXYB12_FULL_65_16]|nr:MAG: hypothetical protein A3K18_03735 [Lentisphaerae bacterium RIFOXYA12_64_32]OGV87706.1 MAG: hypothetical protein A3K19_17120 [Lentisphaerae bacterium RIFOXYB12_FULL_65_16]